MEFDMTVVSSRQFNQNATALKREADRGPVVVTEHGKPAYVLLSYADYGQLRQGEPTLAEAFVVDDDRDFPLPARHTDGVREVKW
jgi:prevent-host-death family protein